MKASRDCRCKAVKFRPGDVRECSCPSAAARTPARARRISSAGISSGRRRDGSGAPQDHPGPPEGQCCAIPSPAARRCHRRCTDTHECRNARWTDRGSARVHEDAATEEHRRVVQPRRAIGSGQCDDAARIEADARGWQAQFQSRCVRGVSHQVVANHQRQAIHGAGRADAEVAKAVPAQILDAGLHGGLEDTDHRLLPDVHEPDAVARQQQRRRIARPDRTAATRFGR